MREQSNSELAGRFSAERFDRGTVRSPSVSLWSTAARRTAGGIRFDRVEMEISELFTSGPAEGRAPVLPIFNLRGLGIGTSIGRSCVAFSLTLQKEEREERFAGKLRER